MRTERVSLNKTNDNGRIQVEAWVVLEMHFLSRPYLIDEAKQRLAERIAALEQEGVRDPRSLKDQACRQIQLMYGPAPALEPQRWVA